MKARSPLVLLLTLIFVVPRLVHAEEPATVENPAPADPVITRTEWYGWQVALADVAALGTGTMLASAVRDGAPLFISALGGPTVHALHGRGGIAVLSLVLHVGAPVVGTYLAIVASSGCQGFLCEFDGAWKGALAGAVTATAIDAAFLSHGTVVEHPAPPPRVLPTVAVAPNGGMVFGLAGRL